MTTLVNARIVQPHGVLAGWIRVADGRIAEIGSGDPTEPPDHDLDGSLVVPGFVDVHVHGGAGGSYPTGDHDQALRAREYHLEHGTTTTVASLVTSSLLDLTKTVGRLAELCDDDVLAGIHLEGPYLARSRCGAHEPDQLRAPDRAELAALLDAGRGHVRMVTVAPELRGANGRTSGIDLIRDVVAWGAVAAVGHTEATYEEARAAFDAGATVATHLFNAMRPLHHREPGPIGAALENPLVTVELINDGVHVADAAARLVFAAADDRVALVSDAMPAAGLDDGDYRLGPMRVAVRGGRATVAGSDAIAGSTITMATAFRRAVWDLLLPVDLVARAASLTPAKVLGLDDEIGSLEVGKRADLVVLDDALWPAAVMLRGSWVRPPRSGSDSVAGIGTAPDTGSGAQPAQPETDAGVESDSGTDAEPDRGEGAGLDGRTGGGPDAGPAAGPASGSSRGPAGGPVAGAATDPGRSPAAESFADYTEEWADPDGSRSGDAAVSPDGDALPDGPPSDGVPSDAVLGDSAGDDPRGRFREFD